MSNGEWIGVDLDCTLAHYERNSGTIETIGKPIIPMLNQVKRWVAQRREVRIVTARVAWGGDLAVDQTKRIHEWLEYHGLPRLQVTAEKDAGMQVLYDDRVVRVRPNVGSMCSGCVRWIADNP